MPAIEQHRIGRLFTSRLSFGFLLGLVVLLAAAAQFAPTATAQEAAASPSIEGTWQGVLGGRLHLELTISKSSTGEYTGEVNSVDQGTIIPIDAMTLTGNTIRFEVNRVGGLYIGALNADGNAISGTWTQRNVRAQDLSFQRVDTSAPAESESAAAPAPEAEAAPPASSAPQHTPKPHTAPLAVSVSIAPVPFQADGKTHLVYELHIMNFAEWACTISRIEVLGGDSSDKPLADFSASDIKGMMVSPGYPDAIKGRIPDAGFAIVYMWVTVNSPAEVPTSLRHRITLLVGDYPEPLVITTGPAPAARTAVPVIQPPLRGGEWLAANGPSNTSIHRRTILTDEGHAWLSQRFAIDWIELYPDGKSYQGDPKDNKNYRAYGAEIHSVVDGVVTQIKDGIPQNVPNEDPAIPITMETVGGNHVIVQIGDGLYAFYAHMQAGSVRVKVGDKVHVGQVLGLVGNSGNSSEPHLHFHICNANSELACEGLPYAFPSYEVQGKGEGWKSSDSHAAATQHTMELPLENEVVRFSSAP